MSTCLEIWTNGQHVAQWSVTRAGVHTLSYTAAWLASPMVRPLSLSLPITVGDARLRGKAVAYFFENLLPESLTDRLRLCERIAAKSAQSHDLLAASGQDCWGGLTFLPPGQAPEGWDSVQATPLDEATLSTSLANPAAELAVLGMGGRWFRPTAQTPSTHILRRCSHAIGAGPIAAPVHTEWLSSQVLRALGLAVVPTELITIGPHTVLALQRPDRRWQNTPHGAQNTVHFAPDAQTWIARLPMEDLCQATRTPPAQAHEANGGPTLATALSVFANSQQADADRSELVLRQLAFWLLAVTQGHGKTHCLYHHRGGGFSLAPMHTVCSAWPQLGDGPGQLPLHEARLGMALHLQNHAYGNVRDIRLRHWQALALQSRVPTMWAQMLALVEKAVPALDAVQSQLPANFPSAIWDAVQAGVRRHARQFLRELELSAKHSG